MIVDELPLTRVAGERSRLATVRRPGVRMAPTSSTWACRQDRWTNKGAKVRMIGAKRAGRGGMAAFLGGDATSLTITPASSPYPASQPAKLAKVELRAHPERC